MADIAYPVRIVQETDPEAEGAHSVYVRDLPELITWGKTPADALAMAEDGVRFAIHCRLIDGEAVPVPSRPEPGEVLVALPATLAVKAALSAAMAAQGATHEALAARLSIEPAAARRLTDPRKRTAMVALEEALAALGRRLVVAIEAEAA